MTGLTPLYRITLGGLDITSNFSERMKSLKVRDADGVNADEVTITLDDSEFAIEPPATGAVIAVWIGYAETGLDLMGLFTVTRVQRRLDKQAGAEMEIAGRSADLKKAMKQQRTGQYAQKSVRDIVSEIAGRHGLDTTVSPKLGAITYQWLGQTEESDLHLLTRLAQDHDAIAKVAGGKVVLFGRDEVTLPAVTLSLTDFIECEVETDDRAQHGKTTAHAHHRGQAKREAQTATGAGDGPEFTLRHLFPTPEDAKAAAEGKQRALDRLKKTLRGKVSGHTGIMAGAPLILAGIAPLYDGQYTLTSVEHEFEKDAGYTTSIEASTDPKKKGKR
jgi:phage protein D